MIAGERAGVAPLMPGPNTEPMILSAVFDGPDLARRAHEVGRVHRMLEPASLERRIASSLMSTVRFAVVGGMAGAAMTMGIVATLWPQQSLLLLFVDAGFVGLVVGAALTGTRAFRTTPTIDERAGGGPIDDAVIVLVEIEGTFDHAVTRLAAVGGSDIRRHTPGSRRPLPPHPR
jgi:hypothetical protein